LLFVVILRRKRPIYPHNEYLRSKLLRCVFIWVDSAPALFAPKPLLLATVSHAGTAYRNTHSVSDVDSELLCHHGSRARRDHSLSRSSGVGYHGHMRLALEHLRGSVSQRSRCTTNLWWYKVLHQLKDYRPGAVHRLGRRRLFHCGRKLVAFLITKVRQY